MPSLFKPLSQGKSMQGTGFEPLEHLNKVVSQSDNNIKKIYSLELAPTQQTFENPFVKRGLQNVDAKTIPDNIKTH